VRLRARRPEPRRVVFEAPLRRGRAHTLTVTNASGLVDVDAVAVRDGAD
jgi:hypothetical protein